MGRRREVQVMVETEAGALARAVGGPFADVGEAVARLREAVDALEREVVGAPEARGPAVDRLGDCATGGAARAGAGAGPRAAAVRARRPGARSCARRRRAGEGGGREGDRCGAEPRERALPGRVGDGGRRRGAKARASAPSRASCALWARGVRVEGAPGFEPGLRESKSRVLPLNDAPERRGARCTGALVDPALDAVEDRRGARV